MIQNTNFVFKSSAYFLYLHTLYIGQDYIYITFI